ncbi:MAG: cupredoxin domain-containing protein [Candidatus Limnocylindrales bacterium]
MRRGALLWIGLGLVASGLVAIVVAATVAAPGAFPPVSAPGPVVPGADGYGGRGPMMGGAPLGSQQPGPGESGFVAGTAAAPRVVQIVATPRLRFVPDTVTVKQGETVTFQVTTMGPLVHEFMVGPSADVAADKPGTPEIADLGMMRSGSVTYTFDGPGPYAFACHATGHFEAGMSGTITVVP